MEGSTARQRSVSELRDQGPARTLLVDDVEALRRLYGTVLEDQGPFEVVAEAGDGAEGIEAAEEHQPDLVLLDLSMPGMDGLEALPKILEVSPESTVVILSGFLEERVGDRARELGADAYLEKGDEPRNLVDRLVDVLEWQWSGHAENGRGVEPGSTPSDEELEQFAYTASHDLQEPLRMVASYIHLFRDRYGDEVPDDGLEMLDYAAEGVERMEAMVDGLLTYSRVTTRGGPLEPVDLGTVLDDAIANLALVVDEAGAEITHEDLPTVPADRGQVLQLFQNLLENAIKFHDGRPSIHVGARQLDDAVEITVEDDGPGIPEDHLERVFALFERGPSATRTRGCGIGLAICKRVVERHGGSILVSSEVGEGTTFTVELPEEPPEHLEDPA